MAVVDSSAAAVPGLPGSAWLIKRLIDIDSDAKLKFVPPKGHTPQEGEVRFDRFEAEPTHEGDSRTFEVLARRFELVNGIALTRPDDDARIALGSQLFDALYEAWRRKRS